MIRQFPPEAFFSGSGAFPLCSPIPTLPRSLWPLPLLLALVYFFLGVFLLFLTPRFPICSGKKRECQDRVQLPGSLCPFLLGLLLSFPLYCSCLFLTSSWSVSPFTLSPCSVQALPEAPQGCQRHWEWPQRASTHLANTEESFVLPFHSSKCPRRCRYRPLWKEGAMSRLGDGGQEKQLAEASKHRAR